MAQAGIRHRPRPRPEAPGELLLGAGRRKNVHLLADQLSSATLLGIGTLTAGTATFTTSSLTVGSHSLTAIYTGDSDDFGSNSERHRHRRQADTTTALTAAPDPSVFGQSVTLTATAPGSGTPTGTVTFFDGATLLGTGTLTAGVATFTTSSLAVGSHAITVTYAGDSDFAGSTSQASAVGGRQHVAGAGVPASPPAGRCRRMSPCSR